MIKNGTADAGEARFVWLRWLFPRVSPRSISVDTHTHVSINQAFSIAVYPQIMDTASVMDRL